jgi:CDP-diacylglycerol--serine O-phosphatidyltransferase
LNIKKYIPNTITCGNLFCGCLAIVKVFEGDLVWATYLIGIAVILDFFDGFTARMLGVASPIGKDLDSLADMVTFGVAPGVILYKLIGFCFALDPCVNTYEDYLPYFGFCISVFSGIRLAKFNNDTRQSDSFIGVPTPTNAIMIASIVLILAFHIDFRDMLSLHSKENLKISSPFGEGDFNLSFRKYPSLTSLLCSPWFYVVYTLLFSFLLVSELPLFALKFKDFKWKGNEIRFIFLILALLFLGIFQFIGIPMVIGLYILLSVLNNLRGADKRKQQATKA